VGAVNLESGLGLITFDGQVLELFGFGEQGSRRIHVLQIRGISLQDGGGLGSQFSVDVGPAGIGLQMMMRLSDTDRAGLQGLIEEIRAAGAP
jgi:hypothetical protein